MLFRSVVDDPYLPETACRVNQIYDARHKYLVTPCTETPKPAPGQVSGIGLGRAMPILRFAAYAEANKWVYPATAAAVIGIPFLVGYLAGRKQRKKTP